MFQIIYLALLSIIFSGCNKALYVTVNSKSKNLTLEVAQSGTFIPTTAITHFAVSGNCSNTISTINITVNELSKTATCLNQRYTQQFDLSALSDGSVLVTVQANNSSGELLEKKKSLTKDTVSPVGGLTFSGLGNSPSSLTTPRSISLLGPLEAYSYKAKLTNLSSCTNVTFEGTPERLMSDTLVLPLLENSLNRICAIARDQAGNWQTTASSSSVIHLDSQAPSRIIELTHPSFFNSTIMTPTFSWEASVDNLGGSGVAFYEISIGTTPGARDVLAWTNIGLIESRQQTINLSPFSNTILYPQIRAVDNVGLRSLATGSNGWYVGTPAVNISFTRPTLSSSVRIANRASFLVQGVCSEAGRNVTIGVTGLSPVNVICSVTGTFERTYNLSSLPDGLLTFTATHDNAFSVSATTSVTITKDTIAPTVAITSPADGSSYVISNNNSYVVSGTCSDIGKNLMLSSNFGYSATPTCASGHTWSTTVDLSTQTSSALVFSVQMMDEVGNQSVVNSRTYVNGSQTLVNREPLTAKGLSSAGEMIQLGTTGKLALRSTFFDNSKSSIVTVNQDGSELNAITPMETATYLGFSNPLVPLLYYQPRDEIFFKRTTPAKDNQALIYSSRADGSGFKPVLGIGSNTNVSYASAELSQDGDKIVFKADRDNDEVYELYVASAIDGSGLIKLSGQLPVGADVDSFVYLSQRGKIIYTADQDLNDLLELYIVNEDGTGRSKISPAFVGVNLAVDARSVESYRVNSLYTHVVFLGDFAGNA